MSSQAIHDIVVGMRRAIKRAEEGSDSDDATEMVSNRGNKLSKRAKYVHEGQLAFSSNYRVNEEIIYGDGAYKRSIISHNPRVYGEDGYEIDPDDEDERYEEAMAEAADGYPYANIRIEELLAPLTAASELATHPTMATPFTSVILSQLTQNACEMLRKERTSLWKMKHLLTKMGGDHTWAPTGMFETEDDLRTFTDGQTFFQQSLSHTRSASQDEADVVETVPEPLVNGEAEVDAPTVEAEPPAVAENVKVEEAPEAEIDPDDTLVDDSTILEDEQQGTESREADPPDAGEDGEAPEPRRMRTRAQAQAVSDSNTRTASPDSESYIDAYFLPPSTSIPDRNNGLPDIEAEELRRSLQLYVQKQEEVCRGAERIYNGLLKAQRLRGTVFKWSKAEGHVGEMSDGEDWYDQEEWMLSEPLKKGQDEEEEDAATTAKKTRTRRQ